MSPEDVVNLIIDTKTDQPVVKGGYYGLNKQLEVITKDDKSIFSFMQSLIIEWHWDPLQVFENLLRLYSGWTSREDEFKAIFLQSGFMSTVVYDKTASAEARFEALVRTFTTVVKLRQSV